MYTGTVAHDWTALRARGAQAVQRAEAGLPWEQDGPRTGSDQDTWLLSFIDVLTLLLTLFVLLLAYQRDDGDAMSVLPKPVAAADIATAAPPLPSAATVIVPAATLSATAPDSTREAPAPQTDSSQSSEPVPVAAPSVGPGVSDSVPTLAAGPQPRGAASLSFAAPHPLLTLNGEFVTPPTPIEPAPAPATVEPAVDQAARLPTAADPVETELPLQRLLADLGSSALAGRVEVNVLPDAVNLEISDNILFAPASAALTAGGRALLDDLAATLTTLPYALSVEGHTDNVPIRTVRYPSNWELAAARASAVTRHLIERGIAADRVRAIGYADTRPRADNAGPEGRARNRRVAFILRMPVSDAAMQTTRVTP